MPLAWIAAASAGGSLISGIFGAQASEQAAGDQEAAEQQAIQFQEKMFNTVQGEEQPFLNAGTNALPYLLRGLGIGGGNTSGTGSLNAPFTMADYHQSPGYNFQLQQGQNSIENTASATGGVGGGNTLKALTSYGQGVANQDYWNAYNAYTNSQNQRFNQLDTIVGSGQNAANSLGSFSGNVAANVGNNMVGIGNAQAAGTIGAANAIGGGIQGAGNNLLLYSLLNQQNNAGGAYNPMAGQDPYGTLYGDSGGFNPNYTGG
jgi:hypothetical protein